MSQEIKICSDASGCFIGGLSAADTIASDTKMKAPCFIKTGGSSSQFLKADGSSDSSAYTTCIGTVVASDISSFTSCQGDVTGIDAGTAITVSDGTTATPQVAVTSTCNTAWNSAKSIADGLATCTGLACTGNVNTSTTGDLTLDISGDLNLDVDGGDIMFKDNGVEIGLIANTSNNLVMMSRVDNGDIIFKGKDSGTTISALTLDMSDGGAATFNNWVCVPGSSLVLGGVAVTATAAELNAATSCTGTVVAGDLTGLDQSACPGLDCVGDITSVSGVAGLSGTALAGAVTLGIDSGTLTPFDQSGCAGLDCVGDITGVAAGSGLTGGGNSGSVTLNIGAGSLIDVAADTVNVDLSELTDGTAAIVPSTDEIVYLDDGSQKRKLFSEIFGSNAYNSTTIPTNNNQLTNGAGYTTCIGTVVAADIVGFTECTGTTTPSNVQTFTNKSGSNSQWTNDEGYTDCTGTVTGVTGTAGVVSSGGTAPIVCIDSTCNTKWNNKTTCTGTVTTAGALLSGSSTTIGVNSGALDYLNQSGCAGLLCTGTVVASDLEGYASGFIGGDGISLDASDMSEVEINADSTVVRTSGNQLIAGIKCFSSVMCTVGNFCAQSQILSGGQDLHALLGGGGGGTTYTGGCGITVFGTLISGCYDSDFQQKVTTNCGSVCLGKCAGKSITEGSGLNNISIGSCAACSVTTGDGNISLGKCAGKSNVSQSGNVAVGDSALLGNTGGSGNTAIGACAGKCVQGSSNLLFGENAGQGMDSMTDSVAIGRNAMCGSTTIANNDGDRNVAIGMDAMLSVSSGEENVAIGPNAGRPISTGASNVFIGACAAGCFSGSPRAITGSRNTGLGEAVMYQLGSGSNNFAVGFTALGCNQSGSDNIALGLCAGKRYGSTSAMTTVCDSIFLGPDTKGAASSQTNTIVIGANAVGCGSNTAMIGASNLTVVCSHGSFSTVSDERDKTCICDLEHGLCFIGDLKPKTFNMVTDRNDKEGSISCKRHGFIAQDVIALEGDDNVIINNDNPDRLGYTGEYIIPILVKGMQEQQAIIEDLKERLEVLEG